MKNKTLYPTFIVLSALDFLLTSILHVFGALEEINFVACFVLGHGLVACALYKTVLVTGCVVMLERIGQYCETTKRDLLLFATSINAIVVLYSAVLVAVMLWATLTSLWLAQAAY